MKNKSWKLTKSFRFEAAHRLGKGYPGKCANVHGHSWTGKIEIQSQHLNAFGFTIDFGELSTLAKKIESKFDHSLMLHESDENRELIALCKANDYKLILLGDNPTCEVLAEHIYGMCVAFLENSGLAVDSIQIEISETCTTSCRYGAFT